MAIIFTGDCDFHQSGAGAVTRSAQEKMRERVSVKDFGAVGDGSVNASTLVVTGTDNKDVFRAAIDAAVAANIGEVFCPDGVFYLSEKIVIPTGITLAGAGCMNAGNIQTSTDMTGAVLLIAGANAGDAIQFEENASYHGLRDITVINVGSMTGRSVVSVVGALYPTLTNVSLGAIIAGQTIASHFTGAGLYLNQAAGAPNYPTLWGQFTNVTCANTYVRNALSLNGQLLANNFTGGQFAGTRSAIVQSGTCNSHTWTGVKFDSLWTGADTSFVPVYRTTSVFGGDNPPVYTYPVISLAGTTSALGFYGCYCEASASRPTTYNDGVNGSDDLYAAIELASTCAKTTILDMSWNGVYLYDAGSGTVVDPQTAGMRHSSRSVPVISAAPFGLFQSIPGGTWTKVQFNNFGADGSTELYWDGTNHRAVITSPGVYSVSFTASITAWVGAGQFFRARMLGARIGGSVTTVYGTTSPATAEFSDGLVSTINFTSTLQVGDVISFEVLQTAGVNKALLESGNTFVSIAKLN